MSIISNEHQHGSPFDRRETPRDPKRDAELRYSRARAATGAARVLLEAATGAEHAAARALDEENNRCGETKEAEYQQRLAQGRAALAELRHLHGRLRGSFAITAGGAAVLETMRELVASALDRAEGARS
jgi:hypothetical protein